MARPCFTIKILTIAGTNANIPDLLRQAARQENIRIFLGLTSSNQVLPAIGPLQEIKGLLFTLSASHGDLNDRQNRVIFLSPHNSDIAREISNVVYSEGIRRVITIYAEDLWNSKNMMELFSRHFRALGGDIVGEYGNFSVWFNLDKNLVEFKNLSYTHIFLPLPQIDAARVISYFSLNSLPRSFIASDPWKEKAETIGNLAKNVKFDAYIPVFYNVLANNRNNLAFVSNYKKLYKAEPVDVSAFSYDSVILLAKMVEVCGVRNLFDQWDSCLEKSLPFDSVTGKIGELQGVAFKRKISIKKTFGTDNEKP